MQLFLLTAKISKYWQEDVKKNTLRIILKPLSQNIIKVQKHWVCSGAEQKCGMMSTNMKVKCRNFTVKT